MGLGMAARHEMEMWDAEEAMIDAMVEGSDELPELTARYECLKEEHKQVLAVEGRPLQTRGLQGTRFAWCTLQAAYVWGGSGNMTSILATVILMGLWPQARPADALLYPRETGLQWQVVEHPPASLSVSAELRERHVCWLGCRCQCC